MSTFATVSLPCPSCGHTSSVRLAESANAARHPPFRAQVLAGTFMRFVCEQCHEATVVERELLYTDLPRGQAIAVFPSERRGEGVAMEQGFEGMWGGLAEEPGLAGKSLPLRRIVFGYAELREKLICADAGLDDRVVEALKLVLLARTSWVQAGSRGLLLVAVELDQLVFEQVGVTTESGPVQSRVPRTMVEQLAADGPLMGLFAIPEGATWVNVARVGA